MTKPKRKVFVSAEQRQKMIAEAAYYKAQKRGFAGGNSQQDWLEAEAEVDGLLRDLAKAPPLTAKQEAVLQKLEAQLKQINDWNEKLDELKKKALGAKSEILADYEKQIEAIAGKVVLTHAKAQELRQHSEEAWKDLKHSSGKIWDEMQKALERLSSHFK